MPFEGVFLLEGTVPNNNGCRKWEEFFLREALFHGMLLWQRGCSVSKDGIFDMCIVFWFRLGFLSVEHTEIMGLLETKNFI